MGKTKDDKEQRRGSFRGRSRTRSAAPTPKFGRKKKKKGAEADTAEGQWKEPTNYPQGIKGQQLVDFIEESEGGDDDGYDDYRHPPTQTYVGERQSWTRQTSNQRKKDSEPLIQKVQRSNASSRRASRTPSRTARTTMPNGASKKILRVKRAALIFLAGFLLAAAIGTCLFCASIQVPAFAWLAAAIAYTQVAEKIVLAVATCLMTASLFCFGFSMNFFHRFRINKRHERQDAIHLQPVATRSRGRH